MGCCPNTVIQVGRWLHDFICSGIYSLRLLALVDQGYVSGGLGWLSEARLGSPLNRLEFSRGYNGWSGRGVNSMVSRVLALKTHKQTNKQKATKSYLITLPSHLGCLGNNASLFGYQPRLVVFKLNSLEPRGSGEAPPAADGVGGISNGVGQAEKVLGFPRPLQQGRLQARASTMVRRAWAGLAAKASAGHSGPLSRRFLVHAMGAKGASASRGRL